MVTSRGQHTIRTLVVEGEGVDARRSGCVRGKQSPGIVRGRFPYAAAREFHTRPVLTLTAGPETKANHGRPANGV